MTNSGVGNQEIQSVLQFRNYVVNSVEFHVNHEFNADESVDLDFQVSREIEFVEDEAIILLVTLNVAIFKNAIERNYPFSMNISVTGFFEVDGANGEQKQGLAEVNAVAILFPYIRALVTTYTANANINPLVLPPINIVKMIESQARIEQIDKLVE
ncbi:protein-export chaperone SecB [Paenibacillus sp. LHD-117]|uniref:protein-export chaperone SecB n=1 Tax=Paenibacillus sp. LHD-117 TaxID=3071412 RepID=UPI0027E1A134|nr:protein-export chaperone SecB [Paenibacillus sp. LHD-117]MDQ6420668.1 protein-export chaperone SecB [Paenibacillus sp. LHD-117]